MKKSIIIEADIRGEQVWLMECRHKNSKTCGHFEVRKVFENEKEARDAMELELHKTGLNMLRLWRNKLPPRTRISFVVIPEQYDCTMNIYADGKVVDKYIGMLHLLTIN